jgi:hypothetical protein
MHAGTLAEKVYQWEPLHGFRWTLKSALILKAGIGQCRA